jgi:PiT family inorganic phosphate transporter
VLLSEGWTKVLLGLLFSTFLGFLGGLLVIVLIFFLFRRAVPGRVRGLFRWLQVFSSGFMAFSHGSNDGQKFMGTFSMALVLGGVLPTFHIPFGVILLCGGVMALGTLIGAGGSSGPWGCA